MDKEAILREKLRVLEELEALAGEEEEEEQTPNNLMDLSGLRALSDPRRLTKLRGIVWPGG